MAGKDIREMSLRVGEIREETFDIKSFRLDMGNEAPLPFKPGQFVIIKSTVWNPKKNRNMRVNRAFSIASSPRERTSIEIAVKRYPGGRMTPWLHDSVRVGDRLHVRGPDGKFFLQTADHGKFVFIAGGVGVAPLRSMIRYLIDIGHRGGIRLYYSARTPLDFAFKAEFDRLADTGIEMRCVYTITRPGPEITTRTWAGRIGRFDREFFRSELETDAAGYFLCGPPAMVKDGIADLRDLGIPASSIHSEMW